MATIEKWVNELQSEVDDIIKRLDSYTPTPPTPPTPSTGYHLAVDTIKDGTTLSADSVTVVDNISDIENYDVIMLTLRDLTEGNVAVTYCPVPLLTRRLTFPIASSFMFMEYEYKYGFLFHWDRRVITGQNYDTLTFDPVMNAHANILASIYGLKIEADETASLLTKATTAVKTVVKKATTRKTKKGGE